MFNKIISYTFYLTNSCMLDCPYCYESCHRATDGTYIMPLEEIFSIIDFANNNYTVEQGKIEFSLFGGEPLFYLKQQVLPIIEYIKKNFQHPFKITFMTNGINVTQELINSLEGTNYFILISLDGPYQYLDNPSLTEQTFNRIINNILSIPIEKRRQNIGVKATLTNQTICHIKEIYDFLSSLQTAIIYISPVHEIDHSLIYQNLLKIKNNLAETRDGQLIQGKYIMDCGIKLFIKKGVISFRQDSVRSPQNLPVGWIINNKIIISKFLLQQSYDKLSNKLFLTPTDKLKCSGCKLKGNLCSPDFTFFNDPIASTGCEWYTAIKEILNELSI